MLQINYGVKRRPITTRNPQANSMVERAHQTLGNIIYMFPLQDMEVDEDDPWKENLSAVMFAMCSTVHTTNRTTPIQLVFGRDTILNVKHEADWKFILQRKQELFDHNNFKENSK